jgi:hypothetical protein
MQLVLTDDFSRWRCGYKVADAVITQTIASIARLIPNQKIAS